MRPQHAITVVHIFTTIAIATTAVLLLITSCLLLQSPWPGFWAGLLYALLGSTATPAGDLGEAFLPLADWNTSRLRGWLFLSSCSR
jgi:hypothetical protein